MKTKTKLLIRGLSLFVVGAALFSAVAPAQAADKKPNIVILMTDDTGWNDFGYISGGGANLGHPTPNIDRIAKEGAHFTCWYGQASCTAGRSSLITGRIPIRSALSIVVAPGDENFLRKETPTIAEFFKKNGYSTFFTGKWHLGDKPEAYPIEHGFDEMKAFAAYYPAVYTYSNTSPEFHPQFPSYNKAYAEEYFKIVNLFEWEGVAGQPAKKVAEINWDYLADFDVRLADYAVAYIKQHAKDDKPFFMDVNFMKKIILTGIVCTAVIAFSSPRVTLAEQGVSDSAVLSPQASISKTVSAFANFMNAGHVANGVALRNRDSGTIHLRGVPSGSTVIKAYLYWNFSDTAATGSASITALFDGNLVIGNKRADSQDPCWALVGNHTYQADVTSFVLPTKPNQDYNVAITFNSATVTSGENPWLSSPGNRKLEGATLIVVFSNAGTAVALYDDLSGTEFSGTTLTVTLAHPISLRGTGLYTMSGADGQRGTTGYDNSASNEKGFFNGVQISGPPVAASDWDGAAGIPLPQLWDVHTHMVTYSGGAASSVVRYSSGSDCLVPVVFVLQANSP